MKLLKMRLGPTYRFLETARIMWRDQLDQHEDDEELQDLGIEVLTYINQAQAKLEKVEELLDSQTGVREGQAEKYN